ncbi:integrating conjugative element protein [Pseudomonas sp. A46]|nr:TIGR03757 family integrating conjugative element protein [Pseudomonas sp. A46]OWJ93172.1 integrating conjugative element protein [Pseudomonas sp. A46]
MPTPRSSHALSRTPSFAAGLCAALLAPLVQANDILVITDSQHPVQAPIGVRVVELDLPARIEAELAAHLANDAGHSAAAVQQRLQADRSALQQRIGMAYQGVVDAWSLGISTIPAVVVDQHYVVYGEPDVAKAVALINSHRTVRP